MRDLKCKSVVIKTKFSSQLIHAFSNWLMWIIHFSHFVMLICNWQEFRVHLGNRLGPLLSMNISQLVWLSFCDEHMLHWTSRFSFRQWNKMKSKIGRSRVFMSRAQTARLLSWTLISRELICNVDGGARMIRTSEKCQSYEKQKRRP